MRWPLARRSTVDQLEAKLARANEQVKDQQRALSMQGHRINTIYRECGQLVTDLRLIRFHVQHHRSGSIHCAFTLFDEALYHAFRRDRHLQMILAMEMERAMLLELGPGLYRGVFADSA